MGTGDARIPNVGSQHEDLVAHAARLPSCADIILLSEWPGAAVSKSNGHIDEPSLRNQFGEVAEADWRHLYRAAIRAGADTHEAEDLVQEVFLRAYRSLTTMDENQLVRLRIHGWLTSLIETVAKKESRQRRAGRIQL
jgi:Sigma-70 region 2